MNRTEKFAAAFELLAQILESDLADADLREEAAALAREAAALARGQLPKAATDDVVH